jgi:translation initiation factor IF-3
MLSLHGILAGESRYLLPSNWQSTPWFRRNAISARPVRINERIRIREVRLIDEDGTQLGVVATRDALEIARERGLDLVEVQPNAVPPVCRLMDYGRFRYEESRRERDSRKKAKGATLKEVRLAPKIGAHDLQTKARQAQRFLEEGDKVKVSVLFRGREMLHQEIGRELLDQMIVHLQPFAQVDQDARMEGRSMSIFLSPKPGARPAAQPAAEAAPASAESEPVVSESAPATGDGDA